MIAPIMIACKERYVKLATISIETFLEYHDTVLYVLVDATGSNVLSNIKHKNLRLVQIGDYLKQTIGEVSVNKFHIFKYDADGDHDRAYSSLKPLLMDKVIADLTPESTYVLSLDVDTLFSGNILNKINSELNRVSHKFDMYMVERRDARMLCFKNGTAGSGFTLWKRTGSFINLFKDHYSSGCAGAKGGSQDLINRLMKRVPSMLFKDPLLHFVSPDLKNPKLTVKEILTFKPAYIHLHGKDSYARLKKFRKIFERGD